MHGAASLSRDAPSAVAISFKMNDRQFRNGRLLACPERSMALAAMLNYHSITAIIGVTRP